VKAFNILKIKIHLHFAKISCKSRQQHRKMIKTTQQILLLIPAFGVILTSMLAFCHDIPQCDLLSQFKVLYLIVLIPLCLASLAVKQWKLLIALGLCFGLNLSSFLPYYMPNLSALAINSQSSSYQFMQVNYWEQNPDPERLITQISQATPDIVAIEELPISALDRLLPIVKHKLGYSAQYFEPGRMLLLSKTPWVPGSKKSGRAPVFLALEARLGSQNVQVIVTHLIRPYRDPKGYTQEVNHLIQLVNQSTLPSILLGDLNTGPWSKDFKTLLRQSHLQDSEIGFGIQPTYPVKLPKTHRPWRWPVLPIDHILLAPQFTIIHRQLGPALGSDHLPVLVKARL
jgi:endonuclease/exonuclease/phosphatase (EEP) superfamily protein YafD